MKERLMRAHFTEGVAVGESDLLLRLAKEVGLDEGETRELLAGDLFAEEVRGDEAAARSYGISGVPFFLVEGRWGISGAQPAEVFSRALEQLWGELHSTSGT
jgi:predicted DsbA family dithiol-disulfide isomerase